MDARTCATSIALALASVIAPSCKVSKIDFRGVTDSGPQCAVFVSNHVDSQFRIEGALRVPERCDIRLDGDVVVTDKGTLTIEKGVVLRFGKGKKVEVAGTLVATGTAQEPVTFTSAATTPAAGDWGGIVFTHGHGAPTPPASSLAHAHVAYAGPSGFESASLACVTVQKGMSVDISGSTIEHCKKAGVAQPDQPGLTRFAGNVVRDSEGISLDLDANALGAVSALDVVDPVRVKGQVTTSQKWPHLAVPILVAAKLAVGAARDSAAPAVLEIADGTKLRFARDGELDVGDRFGGGPGALVAHHVTFTAAEEPPRGGAWKGLVVGDFARGTRLSDCTIEFAGQSSAKSRGQALHFESEKAMAAAELQDVVFRETAARGVAVYVSGVSHPDCTALARAGNRSTDVPLCDK